MIDRVDRGKVIDISYRILGETGDVFEQMDVPVSYLHGSDFGPHESIERALAGCAVGDQVSVEMAADEAFGPYRPELTYTDDLENVPPEFRYVGAEVEMQSEHGEVKTFRVSQIDRGKLTVDGNHPLAGRPLTFKVEVIGIRAATEDELATGKPVGNSEDLIAH